MTTENKTLNVSETFYSIQGEGITVGIPSVFLRLSVCNLLCGGYGTQKDGKLHGGATWRCDTIEVWQKGKKVAIKDVLAPEMLTALQRGAHLIITGGEPLMQQDNIYTLLLWLLSEQITPDIEIETNGTIAPSEAMMDWKAQYNVSPKLSNSGMPLHKRFKPDVITALNFAHRSIFKFVISSEKDFEEIDKDWLPLIDTQKVVLMPAGESRWHLEQTSILTAELCKRYGFRFSPRLHINIWDKKTGV